MSTWPCDYAFDDPDTTGAGFIHADRFAAAMRRILLALDELGELLVPSFPYAVPACGKFGYPPLPPGERPYSYSGGSGTNSSEFDLDPLM